MPARPLSDALKLTSLQATSIVTGVMALVVGFVYFAPTQYVRRPLPSGQTSITEYVSRLGPVWPVLFILMGVAIILAVTARRGSALAHIFAVFGWSFYGSALLIGAAFSNPPTPIVTGTISMGVAAIHFGLMRAHQDAGDGDRG